MSRSVQGLEHPHVTRRHAIQMGAIGLLGLGTDHLHRLRADSTVRPTARSVVFIFLSGGLSQHDSFDMMSTRKPIWRCCRAVQSVLLAGGGIPGGVVYGSSDKMGAFPHSDPQRPENLAATIYHALGIPRESTWHDLEDRPISVYHGDPIPFS